MPYYKLPHTDGALIWLAHGRDDLELAEDPAPAALPATPQAEPSEPEDDDESEDEVG